MTNDCHLKQSAAFQGGVLCITQKGLYVRTTIAMAPFHHLPIDASKENKFTVGLCAL
ncbi:MAG: hypothetical protein WAN11_17460 [Syntrophobacteraceae bacterium]